VGTVAGDGSIPGDGMAPGVGGIIPEALGEGICIGIIEAAGLGCPDGVVGVCCADATAVPAAMAIAAAIVRAVNCLFIIPLLPNSSLVYPLVTRNTILPGLLPLAMSSKIWGAS
jgi:hypothetical protein